MVVQKFFRSGLILFVLFLTACSSPLSREQNQNLFMPNLFQNNMVLQRDRQVNLWGKALAGAKIRIKIQNKTYSTKAGKDGKWLAQIGPLRAGGPFELKVSSKNEQILLNKIFVGDVFLASGQSNMNWSITVTHDYPDYYNKVSQYPEIFFLNNNTSPSDKELDDIPQIKWEEVSRDNMARYSSLAYAFARKMKDVLQVPIGIVQAAQDSSRIEFFMSQSSLKENNEFLEEIEKIENNQSPKNYFAGISFDMPQAWKNKALELRLSDTVLLNTTWLNDYIKIQRKSPKSLIYEIPVIDYKSRSNILTRVKDRYAKPNEIQRFMRGLNSSEIYLKNSPSEHIRLRGQWFTSVTFSHEFPSMVFNSLISPTFPYTFKSVLWYQGESNTSEPEHYKKLFNIMVNDWRERFNYSDLPFFTVQLHAYNDEEPNGQLAEFRLAQEELAEKIPNTYMTTAIDLGYQGDIHPLSKRKLGERLANLVLEKIFDSQFKAEAPSYRDYQIIDDKIYISFDNLSTGLKLKNPEPSFLEISRDGKNYKTVPIALQDNRLVLDAKKAKHIRYAHADNPVMNIFNNSNLPLLPFKLSIDDQATRP